MVLENEENRIAFCLHFVWARGSSRYKECRRWRASLVPQAQAMQSRSIKATLAAKVNVFVLFHFFHLLHRPRTWRTRAQAQGEEVPITDFADAPVFASPPELIPPTQVVQDYYDLAQRLRQLLSPICSWLESEDVQIVDTTAFSSGGSADTWRGLVRGLPVAIKSLRCYSSPEFDPAEVGIVSHQVHAVGTTLTSYPEVP